MKLPWFFIVDLLSGGSIPTTIELPSGIVLYKEEFWSVGEVLSEVEGFAQSDVVTPEDIRVLRGSIDRAEACLLIMGNFLSFSGFGDGSTVCIRTEQLQLLRERILVLERAVDSLSSVLSDPSCSQHFELCQFGVDVVGASGSSHNHLPCQLQNQQAPFRLSPVRTRAAELVPDLPNVQPRIL